MVYRGCIPLFPPKHQQVDWFLIEIYIKVSVWDLGCRVWGLDIG